MFALPRVVAIDNSPQQLEQIREALTMASVPCLPVLYEATLWPPDGLQDVCSAVRLVLLDLNLLDAPTAEAKSIAPLIADVLSKVVVRGPYILAFWSKHGDLVAEVLAILGEQYKDQVVPPIHHVLLDKHDFQVTRDGERDKETAQKLSARVDKILQGVPVLEMLSEWETRVASAAASTVSRLYGLAAEGNPWDREGVQTKLSDLLTWISHETVGRQTAKDIPADSAEQGLVHALADELSRTPGTEDYNNRWAAAMPKIGQKAFTPAADLSPEALNEVFHVATVGAAKGDRGAFSFLPADFVADKVKIKRIFGVTAKTLKNEFVNLEGVDATLRPALLDACKLGLVELSAACDYAQRKDRSLRFVLAALIPAAFASNTKFEDSDDKGGRPRESRHEAIYRLPFIKVKDQRFVCKLNFRYILGLPKESELLGDPLFRIRVPLLDEIAYRCSTHLARPGIIAFR
jgi:hypothetical protein